MALPRSGLASVFTTAPGMSTLAPTQLEFMDYSTDEVAQLLEKTVESRGFKLHDDLNREKLVDILKPAIARCVASALVIA